MKLGKNKVFFLVIFLTFSIQKLPAEDKILSAPLLNLEKLKPSFEEIDQTNSDEINNEVILNTKNKNNVNKNFNVCSHFKSDGFSYGYYVFKSNFFRKFGTSFSGFIWNNNDFCIFSFFTGYSVLLIQPGNAS